MYFYLLHSACTRVGVRNVVPLLVTLRHSRSLSLCSAPATVHCCESASTGQPDAAMRLVYRPDNVITTSSAESGEMVEKWMDRMTMSCLRVYRRTNLNFWIFPAPSGQGTWLSWYNRKNEFFVVLYFFFGSWILGTYTEILIRRGDVEAGWLGGRYNEAIWLDIVLTS